MENCDETYLAFVEGCNELINVSVVSYEIQKLLLKLKFDSAKDFIDGATRLFKPKFKAVILDVFDFNVPEYSNIVEFCIAIKAKLNDLKIMFNFVTSEVSFFSTLFIVENIVADINDIFVIIWFQNDEAHCRNLRFTENGYVVVDGRVVDLKTKNKAEKQNTRKHLNGALNPKLILFFPIYSNSETSSPLKQISRIQKIITSKNLVICDYKNFPCVEKFVAERYKWMLDKSYFKYNVIPRAAKTYEIGVKNGGDKTLPVVICKKGSLLPFKKVAEIPNTALEFSMAYFESGKRYELTSFKLESNAHRYELEFFVDKNNAPKYRLKPFILDTIENLPQKLDECLESKIPVISLFDNSSVICIYKENPETGEGGYQFLESWNGIYGRELLISFNKENLEYCIEAISTYRTKPSFVIYDLLKIMSMPIEKVLSIKTLSYTITKDDKNPILLEFDTSDGTKKLATPAFLMALLLKQHLKVIKNETGEKPKELCFHLAAEENVENQKRIKTQIEESCKLLNIGCSFIEV